jgi:hypothetical protein
MIRKLWCKLTHSQYYVRVRDYNALITFVFNRQDVCMMCGCKHKVWG